MLYKINSCTNGRVDEEVFALCPGREEICARVTFAHGRHLSEENARRFSNLAAENEILMERPSCMCVSLPA